MGDILKEAIADAKAVRETALENAKMALEEAFTPQLKSMLSAKLKEDEFDDEEEVEEFGHDDEEGGDEEAEEGYHEDDEASDDNGVDINIDADGEEDVPDEEPDMEEEGVIEINGVKYAPVVAEEEHEDEEEVDESNLDLEAVIKELESELSEGEDEDDEPVEEAKEKDDDDDAKLKEEDDKEEVDEEYEIDENALVEEEDEDDKDEVDEELDTTSGIGSGTGRGSTDKSSAIGGKSGIETGVKMESVEAELKEYKEAVKFLQSKLHEVNLLNAKLLFTNKLFKEFALDNNQKLKVVETFDRTQSTREIKLVYSTLAEQFSDNGTINRKKSITESASTKSGSTKPSKESKKVISEETEVANRFKKLAGILNG